MNLGPYKVKDNRVVYKGNKIFKPLREVRRIKPPDLTKRHFEVMSDAKKWETLIKIWDGTFRAVNKFMADRNVLLFDLPITTRMISSPGALTGTIISDVDPFKIKFFNKETFLTQSSQLYLEFAITNPNINSVYCWEKSFRREKADFRHLPEFAHIEFESNVGFEENLKIQQEFLQFIVKYLFKNLKDEIKIFLSAEEIKELQKFSLLKKFQRITFHRAFELLKQKTNNPKYNKATITNFGAYEEILLTEIIKKPIFVTHYIGDEVAFYHANDLENSNLTINADLLFPGYGELIGSGERVHTKEETRAKAKYFKLNMRDYQPYIESRTSRYSQIHSGWGMGIERFIQIILKMPFIWDTKVFPRVHYQNHP